MAFVTTTDCEVPENWFKASRGFRASASLPLQRNAKDKKAALSTDASTTRPGCNQPNSNPTFSTLPRSSLFETVQNVFLRAVFDAWNSTV
jgi:hypothetical protein